MSTKLLFTFILAAFLGIAVLAQAAEVYIDVSGNVKVDGAEISQLNNNIVVVKLWGTRWSFFVPTHATVTNASGEPITVWKLESGHKLYVEGNIKVGEPGVISVEVTLLRDLSMPGNGPALLSSVRPAPVIQTVVQNVCPQPQTANAPQSTGEKSKQLTKNLRPGMRDDEVRLLQEFLHKNNLLSADSVTGYYGKMTSQAVSRFQQANTLEAVGIAGPLTRELINSLLIQPR